MSFLLYRVSATSARVVRVAPRISVSSRSPFSISAPVAKSPLDPVKDTLKSVDRTVSDAAVKGIEKGGRIHVPFDPLSPYQSTLPLSIHSPLITHSTGSTAKLYMAKQLTHVPLVSNHTPCVCEMLTDTSLQSKSPKPPKKPSASTPPKLQEPPRKPKVKSRARHRNSLARLRGKLPS